MSGVLLSEFMLTYILWNGLNLLYLIS